MNYFFKKQALKNHISVLTGGQLELTKKIILKLNNNTIKEDILVIYKDYDIAKDKFYQEYENIKVFKCDLSKTDQMEDLLHYLKNFKVNIFQIIRLINWCFRIIL